MHHCPYALTMLKYGTKGAVVLIGDNVDFIHLRLLALAVARKMCTLAASACVWKRPCSPVYLLRTHHTDRKQEL